jgi:hypothetical protein
VRAARQSDPAQHACTGDHRQSHLPGEPLGAGGVKATGAGGCESRAVARDPGRQRECLGKTECQTVQRPGLPGVAVTPAAAIRESHGGRSEEQSPGDRCGIAQPLLDLILQEVAGKRRWRQRQPEHAQLPGFQFAQLARQQAAVNQNERTGRARVQCQLEGLALGAVQLLITPARQIANQQGVGRR